MPRYDETPFRATHNSYSGGARGSIEDQLSGGVRVIELDFHANGYAELGDFRVGHLKPGMEVAVGNGNPDTLKLSDWLGVVARWSNQHVHAPITIVLDSKDDLIGPGCGGFSAFNQTLDAAFGAQLFTRDDRDAAGAWPDTTALGNRILCVLSGNGNTRASYRWAFGSQPAMATNPDGDVVVVYRSTSGDLNCFLGAIDGAGAIRWQYKATYWFSKLPLSQPAVSLNDEGWIVAAHQFEPPRGFVGSRASRASSAASAPTGATTWFGLRGVRHRRRTAARAARGARSVAVPRRVRTATARSRESLDTQHGRRSSGARRARPTGGRAAARRHRRLRRAHRTAALRRSGGDPARADRTRLAGALPAARVRRGAEGRRPRHDPGRALLRRRREGQDGARRRGDARAGRARVGRRGESTCRDARHGSPRPTTRAPRGTRTTRRATGVVV